MTRSLPLLALALAACAPYVTTTPIPAAADPFDCVVSRLGSLGYTVENASREARTIRGVQKSGSGAATIVVAFFEAQGARQMRITADDTYFGTDSQGTHPKSVGATKPTRADAEAVRAACAAPEREP
jgi:hypothetical protein